MDAMTHVTLLSYTARRESSADIKKISVSSTCVHTVQIVLPVHANHHGTTFGGQV